MTQNDKISDFRYRSCESKFKYKNWKQAQDAIKAMVRNGVKGKHKPYHCRFCHGYHIGRQFKKDYWHNDNR